MGAIDDCTDRGQVSLLEQALCYRVLRFANRDRLGNLLGKHIRKGQEPWIHLLFAFGIERCDDVMFVSQVETHESIRAFFPPGTTSPMHASGIGKALLSCFEEDQVTRFLRGRTLEQFTPRTLTSAGALRAGLQPRLVLR